MARESNAGDYIGSGGVLLALGAAITVALARSVDEFWIAWVVGTAFGVIGGATLLIGVIAQGIAISKR